MALELTKQLIKCPSITPDDQGCQILLANRLKKSGFDITLLPFENVKNFFARRGHQPPLFVFLGHTDVVPPGSFDLWLSPPFEPTEQDGYLYGRGAQDMKSSLAAMVIACERFLEQYPYFSGSIGFLLTSDEEGFAINGTAKVIEVLKNQGVFIDYCLVGEPSSQNKAGDTLKIGRRGSLSAVLSIVGKQGHVAYPHLAQNPVHTVLPALQALIETDWDGPEHAAFFDKTSLQIVSIEASARAMNVIPGILTVQCNFRYALGVTAEALKQRFENILIKFSLNYAIQWTHSAAPFLTLHGPLLKACQESVEAVLGISPVLSTGGGTSDGRFIAPLGSEVVELGVCNDTIHQVNERVKKSDIKTLTEIYQTLLYKLFFK